jgi:hypothetical protein
MYRYSCLSVCPPHPQYTDT